MRGYNIGGMHNTYTWFVKNFADQALCKVIQLSTMELASRLSEREAAVPMIVEAAARYDERRARFAPPIGQIALTDAEQIVEPVQSPE